MLRNCYFCWSLCFLILLPGFSLAQKPLNFGKTSLDNKKLELKKVNCYITPEIVFDTNNRKNLTVTLNVDWQDENNIQINNSENYLYLIDDFDKWANWIKEIDNSPDSKESSADIKIKSQKPIIISENNTDFQPRASVKGFLEIAAISDPISLNIDGSEKNNLRIAFYFTYVTKEKADKIVLEEANKQLTWIFSIPSKLQPATTKILAETDTAKISTETEEPKLEDLTEKEVVKTEPEVKKKEPELAKEEPEAEVKRNLKAEADTLRKKYEGIYSDLSVEFRALAAAINISQENIENRLNSNAIRISSVNRMFENKDRLSADSLNQMSNELKISKNENQDNDSSNHALLNLIRNFKDKIEREKSYCISEFQRLDKKTIPAECKIIQIGLDELFVQASKIESSLDKFRVEIYRQNTAISELITKIEGKEELLVTKEFFDNGFNKVLSRLENLKLKYNELDQDFNNKKFSKWYFKWRKEKFLSDINEINNSHNAVKNSFDSLILKKNDSFKIFDFDPLIDSQQEFEKADAGFTSRLETLKTNIKDWEYMPFPYFKVVIAFIITSLLVFGFIVYFMALKRRKIKTIPLRSSKNPSKNFIKLQQTEIKKTDKGKGLSEQLRESKDKYLELDLSLEWEDSCVKSVYFERDCIIRTYRFFEDSIHIAGPDTSANETGGYLIGQWDFNKEDPQKYDVSIEDFIEPGDDATFSKYQLNFGAKIGVKLQTVLDNYRQKTNRDLVLTAWFHSHPGLKIFLSDYDLTVQEDFAGNINKHKMIALVLDPYTPLWDMGIFTYKSNGEMNNASDSIRFFSFDSIYHWALNPQPQYQLENYFTYNLSGKFSDTIIKKIFFSNPCILEIKRFVEDARLRLDPEGISAYLVGEKILHQSSMTDIIIDNIVRTYITDSNAALKESKIVGTIICLSSQDKEQKEKLRNRLNEMKAMEETMRLLLVFDLNDDSFLIVPKMNYGEIDEFNQESMAKILLTELIEWTRKRK